MANVLICDAALVDRKRMRSVLEAAGHSALEVSGPSQAVTLLPDLAPGAIDLILTELNFENESGLAFVRWIKEQPNLQGVPILVVTPQQPRDQVIDLVKVGVSTIVAKPFGSDLLLRRVTETLAEHKAALQGDSDRVSWQVDDFVRRELKRADRRKMPFSVVVCLLNDGLFGRAVPLLMGGLVQIMRETDVLVRAGDKEVVILLPDTDAPGARVVEGKIKQVAERMVADRPDTVGLHLTVQTGATTYPEDAGEGTRLMALARERARSALRQA